MNADSIRKRISDLEGQKEQAIATANACHGAIEENKRWLAAIESAEERAPGLSLVSGDGPEPPDPEAETETAP